MRAPTSTAEYLTEQDVNLTNADREYLALADEEMGGGAPHCDGLVLHAPSKCRFCDQHPDLQAARKAAEIGFTGERPQLGERLCFAERLRSADLIHGWGGNLPSPKDAKVIGHIQLGYAVHEGQEGMVEAGLQARADVAKKAERNRKRGRFARMFRRWR